MSATPTGNRTLPGTPGARCAIDTRFYFAIDIDRPLAPNEREELGAALTGGSAPLVSQRARSRAAAFQRQYAEAASWIGSALLLCPDPECFGDPCAVLPLAAGSGSDSGPANACSLGLTFTRALREDEVLFLSQRAREYARQTQQFAVAGFRLLQEQVVQTCLVTVSARTDMDVLVLVDEEARTDPADLIQRALECIALFSDDPKGVRDLSQLHLAQNLLKWAWKTVSVADLHQ